MKVVRTSANYDPAEHIGEVNNLPSETIPDQTIPLRKLLENYTRGALPVGATPYWDADETIDPKTLDLVDIQELAMESRTAIDGYNAAKTAKAKQEYDEYINLRDEKKKLGSHHSAPKTDEI